MKIFVNDEEIIAHNGAKVLDVVRSYYAQQGIKLQPPLPIVTDAFDNCVATDGKLSEGNHLYIKIEKRES